MITNLGRGRQSDRRLASVKLLAQRCCLAACLLCSVTQMVPAQPDDRFHMERDNADPEALGRAIRDGLSRFFGGNREPARQPAPVPQAPRIIHPPEEPLVVQQTVRRPTGPCARSELNREETQELQALLNEILGGESNGAGAIDGVCGSRTLTALTTFVERHAPDLQPIPSRGVLNQVREVGATVANRAIMHQAEMPGDPALWRRSLPDALPAIEPAAAPSPAHQAQAPLAGDPAIWRE
jgi:hypothetical protein